MPSYLLPCNCGQTTVVSTAEAGQSVRCVCGTALEVPTLRGLRDLERAEAPTGNPANALNRADWNNRHRLAFVLIVLAICAAATAGYMAIRLPPARVGLTDQQMEEWMQTCSVDQVFAVYRDVQQGIEPVSPANDIKEFSRETVLGIMGIAVGVGALACAAAVIVLRGGARQSR